MRVDLLAGTAYTPAAMPAPVPTILVFDSGLGGLTVFAEAVTARPDARFVYAADDAGFPYGRLAPEVLVARVLAVMDRLIEVHAPDLVVVACHTASTLVLPHLRERFRIPFIGTVPAIKPAAGLSHFTGRPFPECLTGVVRDGPGDPSASLVQELVATISEPEA